MMRQQMASGTTNTNTGPKRVDKNMYQELTDQQSAKAQQQIQSQANTFGTSLVPSAKNQDAHQNTADVNFGQKFGQGPPPKKADSNVPNWRMGKFNAANDEDNYMYE